MAEKTIRFIPIKNGDAIEIGDLGIFGVSGKNKYLGFKPAGGRKLQGWLVVALGDPSSERPRKLRKKNGNER